MKEDLSTAFHSRTRKGDGCWEWKGSRKRLCGCLSVYIDGKRKQYKARDAAWMLYKGEIPKGMTPRNTCNDTYCVNPDHLELFPIHSKVYRMIENKPPSKQMWDLVLSKKWVNDRV